MATQFPSNTFTLNTPSLLDTPQVSLTPAMTSALFVNPSATNAAIDITRIPSTTFNPNIFGSGSASGPSPAPAPAPAAATSAPASAPTAVGSAAVATAAPALRHVQPGELITASLLNEIIDRLNAGGGSGGGGVVTLAGDASGVATANRVSALQNRPVADLKPIANGQVLTWVGSDADGAWVPTAPAVGSGGSSALAGDVNGPPGQNRVTLLQQHKILDMPPSNGQVLTWIGDTANGSWMPQTPLTTGGGGGGGGGGGQVGLGGDLSGTSNQATVVRLRNQNLSTNQASKDGQVLRWSADHAQWEPQFVAGTVVAAGRLGPGQFQNESYFGSLSLSNINQVITVSFAGFDPNRFNYILRTTVGTTIQNIGNEQPYFAMAVSQNFNNNNNLSFGIFKFSGSQLVQAELDQNHFITIEVAAYLQPGAVA